MTTTFLAAPGARTPGLGDGQILGAVGAGGLALALSILLIAGVKKGKLKSQGAALVAFAAATSYAGAGGFWAAISDAVGKVARSLTNGHTQLGNVGPGALALVLLIFLWVGGKTKTSAWVGLCAGVVWGGAGGIWVMPSELVSAVFQSTVLG